MSGLSYQLFLSMTAGSLLFQSTCNTHQRPQAGASRVLAVRQSRCRLPALRAAFIGQDGARTVLALAKLGEDSAFGLYFPKGNIRSPVPYCDQPKAELVLFVAAGPNMPTTPFLGCFPVREIIRSCNPSADNGRRFRRDASGSEGSGSPVGYPAQPEATRTSRPKQAAGRSDSKAFRAD